MERNVIVAKTLSKSGGTCGCGCLLPIRQLAVIYKISAEGSTTSKGNGPGFWVGGQCAAEYSDPRGLREPLLF